MNGLVPVLALYGALALFLILALIDSRLRARLKVTLVIAAGLLVGVSLPTLQGLLGWPIDPPLPERFQVLGTHIAEPDKQSGTAGSIFLWVAEIDERNLPLGPPRSFILPLTEEAAEDTSAAQEMLAEGKAVIGETAKPETDAEQKDPSETNGNGTERPEEDLGEESGQTVFSNIFGPLGEMARINFSEMPSVELPPKE